MKKQTFCIKNYSENISRPTTKFPVFSLSRKHGNHIPRFSCGLATMKSFQQECLSVEGEPQK